MKSGLTLKTFSALSFDSGHVTAAGALPASLNLPPLAEANGACGLVGMPGDVPALSQGIGELLAETGQVRIKLVCERPADLRQGLPIGGSIRDQLDRQDTDPFRFVTPRPWSGLNE